MLEWSCAIRLLQSFSIATAGALFATSKTLLPRSDARERFRKDVTEPVIYRGELPFTLPVEDGKFRIRASLPRLHTNLWG